MSYNTLKRISGKRAVSIVELYVDKCIHTYGTAPCTAAVPTTGAQKCFNSRATCQDKLNYSKASVIYRFATSRVDGLQAVGEPPTFPTLLSVDTAPVVLTPGKGLGVRGSLKVSIQDHPWTDVGTDPYLSTRTYTPITQGTFWGKFVARSKFYVNRRIDVLTGFFEEDGSYNINNFKRRSYVVTRVTGPDASGRVEIEAKDPLRFADGEKVQWPTPSKATLAVAVNNTATTLTVTDTDNVLTGWYAAGQRYLRIENEIMLATAFSYSAPTATLTVVRGSMPSWYDFSQNIAVDHAIGGTVQQCWLWTNERIDDLVYFLLNDVAGIDPAFLPLADWAFNIDEGFQSWTFSALLTEPWAVKDLLTEITQHSILIWWNERDQEVQLKGLRFQQLIGPQINDTNAIKANSVGATDDTGGMITQFWMFFDVTWPLANPKLLSTYRNIKVVADLEAESDDEYAKASIVEVRSRWLTRADTGVASEIGRVMVRQYSQQRKVITWEMDPKDDSFWVGDVVGVATAYVQDESGSAVSRNYLVTQAEEVWTEAGFSLKYTALEQYALNRSGRISPNTNPDPPPIGDMPDYSAASDANKNRYAFISPNTPVADPLFSDGTPAYQIV